MTSQTETSNPDKSPSRLMLTRRGKLGIGSAVVAAAAGILGPFIAEANDPPTCEVAGTHTILQGESVWGDVAEPLSDDEPTDLIMTRIAAVNPDIESLGQVQPGDVINVPGECN